MQYRVHNGVMEEYPDGTLNAPEGTTLEASGVFGTKAEAKAFKINQINSEIRSYNVILANLVKHLESASLLEE